MLFTSFAIFSKTSFFVSGVTSSDTVPPSTNAFIADSSSAFPTIYPAASMLLQKGVDIETVAELMGHSAISITQVYLHSSSASKNKCVNKLNSILN